MEAGRAWDITPRPTCPLPARWRQASRSRSAAAGDEAAADESKKQIAPRIGCHDGTRHGRLERWHRPILVSGRPARLGVERGRNRALISFFSRVSVCSFSFPFYLGTHGSGCPGSIIHRWTINQPIYAQNKNLSSHSAVRTM